MRPEIERVLDAVDGLVRGGAVFSADADAPAWWCNGTEVAHFDGALLDLRLGRKLITELRRAGLDVGGEYGRIRRRTPSSDWIEIAVATPADLDVVRDLAVRVAAAHAPPPGVPAKPPPTGLDLERRRRWH